MGPKRRRGLHFAMQASAAKPRPPKPRGPALAGLGRLRKIACLGGAPTLQHAPWTDPTWELWAHHSCRHLCKRDPDLLFDLHPKALWSDPKKKNWDPKYVTWLAKNRIPILMQEVFPEAPASMKYPYAQMITEFPRGYMTNTLAYMIALALMEGVTHLGVFGCDYATGSEYGPQRGSAEYWLGLAEGRGVRVLLPPGCDLLNKPALMYGYESHPNGVRDPSYSFSVGPLKKPEGTPTANGEALIPSDHPKAPPLMDIGVPPEPWSKDIAWA